VSIEKKIPVAAGLGGGSSDAATALRLANATLPQPLSPARLAGLARMLGADVPFFLAAGPQLGTGDGSELSPLELPQEYAVLLVLPSGATKSSTGDVYRAFDRRGGEQGFPERREALLSAAATISRPADLADLPANDLAASPLSGRLLELGAFRADVSGAGPGVFGLFDERAQATAAAEAMAGIGKVWLVDPAW
jgi:4-diphosphocytidyl-2-C-methyl-D-erythritol kinase